jgi:hypothetical protein
VGGRFTTLRAQPREHIGRLNPDGSLDAGFNPGANDEVSSFALETGGRILVGGLFTTLGNYLRSHLGRLIPIPEAKAEIVHDNSVNDLNRTYGPNGVPFGDEISLSGTNRDPNDFKFEYFLSGNASGDETLQLRFYANDGPVIRSTLFFDPGLIAQFYPPGTLLYTSPILSLQTGFQTAAASGFLVKVPDHFTWIITFHGLDAGEVGGLRVYDPPTIGSSFADIWQLNGAFGWNPFILNDPAGPANFAARVSAITLSPEPPKVNPEIPRGIITTRPGTIRGVPPPVWPPTPVDEPTLYPDFQRFRPLLVESKRGNEIILNWTTNAVGYSLERATNLGSSGWKPDPSTVIVVDGQYAVTNRMANGRSFYRLKK